MHWTEDACTRLCAYMLVNQKQLFRLYVVPYRQAGHSRERERDVAKLNNLLLSAVLVQDTDERGMQMSN